MNKKIVIILALLVAIFATVTLLAVFRDSQSGMSYKRGVECVGMLKIVNEHPFMVELENGIVFKIDTGSDITTLTESDLAILDSLGLVNGKSIYWNVGRDGVGALRFEKFAEKVDLPLTVYVFEKDSLDNDIELPELRQATVINNVSFAPAKSNFSVLGIDFLKKFVIEYLPEKKMIALYDTVPEGYSHLSPIGREYSLIYSPWTNNRYFVNIGVDGNQKRYFIDTGLQDACLKLPYEEHTDCRRKLKEGVFKSFRVQTSALIDPVAWVSCGNRAGSHSAYYCESGEEPYAVNLFKLFSQDVVIDFKNKQLCLRPSIELPRQRFVLRGDSIKQRIDSLSALPQP